MPTIFIDNKPCQVKEGQNLLHAALSLGLDVPYFCWHPALGSVGACRQCAVQQFKDESDTKGKMVMSCMTQATEGMRISIEHPTSKEFRAKIIEWMMTNHPHDCPVCDEGGECHLQDMTVMTGHNYRRFRFKKRTFRNQNLGPFINHEMNRCITCYRCVRYYKDVAGGKDLSSFASSNRVYFGRHEDGTLENEFSGNLVEVCPTGVFTDKPFKGSFTRKWDLQTAPSVCQLCSVGCNILPGERYQSLRRVQNRYNPNINGYFICDRGRFGHSFVNSKERLYTHNPIEAFAEGERVIGIGSARASLETNFALRSCVGEENFFVGTSKSESELAQRVLSITKSGPATSASVTDIEQADVVLVLGEDLTNTAPMFALAIRKGVYQRAQSKAALGGIAPWHDIAVRNLVRDDSSSVLVATVESTKLEELAAESHHADPDGIARLGFAIAHEIHGDSPLPKDITSEVRERAVRMAAILKDAKRPVIVSGTSLQSHSIVEAAANIAWAICRVGVAAQIAYVLPECNSFGLAMLGNKNLDDALEVLKQGNISTAVVVENDISRRFSSEQFESFFSAVPRVVCIDSFNHNTCKRARDVVCVPSFAETSGTLVNNEGRAQRFYKVFSPRGGLLDAWRAIGGLFNRHWTNLDHLTKEMCESIEDLKPFGRHVFHADYRMGGQKIPRETLEYSGRTAVVANINVHEQAPPKDPDSPLSHSMEGYVGQPPAELTPFFWSPGWNSVQSLNKYQTEVGGAYKNDHAGFRLFEANAESQTKFFDSAPSVFQKKSGHWKVIPQHHIFGSEERATMSLALAQRVVEPYIGISHEDAHALKIGNGSIASVFIGGKKIEITAFVKKELQSGTVLFPVGLSFYPNLSLPETCVIQSAGAIA